MGVQETIKNVEDARALAKELGGESRISSRGVPHVIVKKNGVSISVCWMGEKRVWRVFWPYPGFEQKRESFQKKDELVKFISEFK